MRDALQRVLHVGAVAAVVAFGAVAVEGVRNPAFAQPGACRWGTPQECFRQTVCVEKGWTVTFWPPSFGQTCLSTVVETYYWIGSDSNFHDEPSDGYSPISGNGPGAKPEDMT